MRTVYAVRLFIALLIGCLLASVWIFFFFGGAENPAKVPPGFSVLAWEGVARLLLAAGFTFTIWLGLFLIGLRADSASKRGGLIAVFLKGINGSGNIGWPAKFGLTVLLVLVLASVTPTILAPLLEPVLATFWVLWTAEFEYMVDGNVWRSLTADASVAVFWIYTKGLFVPCLLFIAPFQWTKFSEKLSEHALYRRLFVLGKGGSARWAGPASYAARPQSRFDNIFVGRTNPWDVGLDYGKDIGLGDDAHLLTIGCAGSGKSITAIWPNLATYQGGVVVLDPKGEHARMTFWCRTAADLAQGKCKYTRVHLPGRGRPQAYKLDPFVQEPSIPNSNYNPLSEINIDDNRVLEKLAAISDGCVLPEGEKNQHWTEGSKTILEGVMAHVLSEEPEENRNLPYVHDLLLGFDPELGISDLDRFADFIAKLRMNPVAGGICFKAANFLANDAKGTMMTSVLRSIKWIGDPAMRKHLSGPSDFRFASIPDDRAGCGNTVYIVAPIGPLMKEQVRWLRVLTNLSVTIIRLAPKPKIRTLFILDEFPQLQGKLTAVEEGIVTLRSAHIRLWPFIQQIGQLKKDYGANWNTFISSSNVQAFGVTDPETAEWISEAMLGSLLSQKTEGGRTINEGVRPLWTAREVMSELGKNEPRQIVFPNDGGFPMRLERLAYKSLVVEGKRFRGLPLQGRFEEDTA